MTPTDDPILRELSDANPVADDHAYEPNERQRVLHRVTADRGAAPSSRARPHRRRGSTAITAATSVLVVAVVVAVVVLVGHKDSQPSTTVGGGHSVVTQYRVEPAASATQITSATISRDHRIIAERVRLLTSAPIHVTLAQVSRTDVTLSLRSAKLTAAQLTVLGRQATPTGELTLYDWEADVLLPDGKPAAAQLPNRNPTAVQLSQGGPHGAGAAGSGGMTLYDAVKLASQQPTRSAPAATLSHIGAQYYAFGAPGSIACRAAARDTHTPVIAGAHCYLAGPTTSLSVLRGELPSRIGVSAATALKVPEGTALLQSSGQPAVDPASTTARYFVLQDHVAVTADDITHPRTSTDPGGQPDVEFGFTRTGAKRFQAVTGTVAHRGAALSTGATEFLQHFAIALDGRIITVPQINWRQYPGGIIAQPGTRSGAQITGGLSASQAKQMAIQLRTGTLPLALKPTDQNR